MVSSRKGEECNRIFIDGHRECLMTLNMSSRSRQLVNNIIESLLEDNTSRAEWLCLQENDGSERIISLTLLGLTYFVACNPRAAAEVIDEVLSTNPDFFPALNIAGDILYQQRIFNRAEEALTRSIELEGSQKNPRILLAELYKVTGRQDKALAVLDGLRQDFPDNAVVWSKICQIHDDRGTIRVAEEMLKKELQRSEDNFGAWHNLGVVYHDTFRLDAAERALLRALDIYSGDTNTMVTLGKVYKLAAKNEEAIDVFQRVLAVDPEESEALFELAGIMYFQGNHDEARSLYAKAAEMDPSVAHRNLFYFLGDGVRMDSTGGIAEE
jgi:tetratricopeptide (TPR) repeat protein